MIKVIDHYFGFIQYKTSNNFLEKMCHISYFFEVYLEAGRRKDD